MPGHTLLQAYKYTGEMLAVLKVKKGKEPLVTQRIVKYVERLLDMLKGSIVSDEHEGQHGEYLSSTSSHVTASSSKSTQHW